MMVTREDVARLAGVSGTTVSYVLNGTKSVTPEVRQRVLAAAEELNYHPSLLARGLVTKETKQIAILVKSLQNPYYSAIHEGIQNVAAREGYIVSVLSAHNSPKQNMNTMLSRGIDGVIVAAASSLGDFEDFLKPTSPMAFVSADVAAHFYRKAVFDMVSAFRDLGHRRIAFLSGLPIEKPSHYRYRDFMDALQTYEMDTDPELVINGDGVTDEQSGYWAADKLLKRGVPFTGVFATNDLMAIGAMKRFWEAGLRIPEDISICGCDGIIASEFTTPPLATLESHAVTLGAYLMYQLLEKMQPGRNDPQLEKQIHAEFLLRESMGPARKE
jgi:DNA-binding LacI/PurR family transcriptional regulator